MKIAKGYIAVQIVEEATSGNSRIITNDKPVTKVYCKSEFSDDTSCVLPVSIGDKVIVDSESKLTPVDKNERIYIIKETDIVATL